MHSTVMHALFAETNRKREGSEGYTTGTMSTLADRVYNHAMVWPGKAAGPHVCNRRTKFLIPQQSVVKIKL